MKTILKSSLIIKVEISADFENEVSIITFSLTKPWDIPLDAIVTERTIYWKPT